MTLFEAETAVQGRLFEPEVFRQIRERALSSSEKGRLFEKIMRAAFEINPEFDFEHVWLWNDWPNRTQRGYGVDIGVDLVAQRTNGGLVAVQCKFYEDSKAATQKINDFLAVALNPDFGGSSLGGSILVTTGRVPKHAATKLIRGATKLIDLAHLESWPVDWLAGLEDPDAVTWDSEPKKPFQHQRQALNDISKGFQQGRRGTVVMPCGTGKSLVAMWAAEEHAGRGGSVLYAVPSIALMGQTMREWAQNRSLPHDYLGVCSDPSTGRLPKGAADELAAVQIPVSTDRAEVADRLAGPAPTDAMRVVLTTYQSLPVVADAIEQANQAMCRGGHGFEPFDLFVLDEAHRTTGIEDADAKTGRVSGFRLAHDDHRLPALRRLYMTATPRVFTPRLKAKAAKMSEEAGRDLDSYSMDDEAVYGPRFFQMAFSDAIDRGLLTDYRVLVVGKRAGSHDLDDAYVEVLRTEDAHRKSSARGGLVAEGYATKLLGVLDALAAPKTVRGDPRRMSGQIEPDTGAPLRSAILFASTVAKSKLVGAAGEFADLLGSDHSLLSAISDDLRAKSRGEGKELGYIVIPVVVPEGSEMTSEEVLAGSDFSTVWEVVRALRSHDDRVDHWLNGVSTKPPIDVIAPDDGGDGADADDTDPTVEQLTLDLQIKQRLEREVFSKMVDLCGDRQMWPTWGKNAAKVCDQVRRRLSGELLVPVEAKQKFETFLTAIRETAGERITYQDAQEMVAQHVVTIPIFDADASDTDHHAIQHGTAGDSGGVRVGGPARNGTGPRDALPAEALLIASTSNRTVFDTLATTRMPDLHTVDPACRALPRYNLG